jgi:hypothetical protein
MFMTATAKFQNLKIYGLLLISIMLLGTWLSPAMSSLNSNVTIGSSGMVVTGGNSAYPSFAIIMGFTGSAISGDVLADNLAGVCSTLKSNAVQYAIILMGYWDMKGSTVEVTDGGQNNGSYNNDHPASFWQNVVTQLHSSGIKAIAMLQDGYTYNSAFGEMNIGSTYYSQYEKIIQAVMNLGYDGFCDDMESWVGGSWSVEVAFENALASYLHTGSNFNNGLARLATPTFGSYYWYGENTQGTFSGLDYAIVQYYDQVGTSTGVQWWDIDFGLGYPSQGYAKFTVPCPIILLTTEEGASSPYNTVSGQISWIDNMIQTTAHPQLYSFGFYHYEDLTSADWAAWTPWIETTLPSLGVPPA